MPCLSDRGNPSKRGVLDHFLFSHRHLLFSNPSLNATGCFSTLPRNATCSSLGCAPIQDKLCLNKLLKLLKHMAKLRSRSPDSRSKINDWRLNRLLVKCGTYWQVRG
jgi:hypothetical protein